MRHVRIIFGLLLLTGALGSTALAQGAQRTFVSGLGSDGNPCSRTAPCRTFGQAISQTNAGGEVYVLDSAGYGAFSINKSISVVAPPGVGAGISVFSGDGVTINAGASDTVILRGLTVNNQGSTGNGITFNTGGTLHIESCVVNGFSNPGGGTFGGSAGLLFLSSGRLEVKDSIMRGNFNGIVVAPASGTAVAAVDQARLEAGPGAGLFALDGSKVVVRNSLASDNGTGFLAFAIGAGPAELDIENCVAFNNSSIGVGAGANAGATVTVRVSNSTVTNNASFGFFASGVNVTLLSRGNNTVEGNGTNASGAGSFSAK